MLSRYLIDKLSLVLSISCSVNLTLNLDYLVHHVRYLVILFCLDKCDVRPVWHEGVNAKIGGRREENVVGPNGPGIRNIC